MRKLRPVHILFCIILSLAVITSVFSVFYAYADEETDETDKATETQTGETGEPDTLESIEVITLGLKTEYQIDDPLDVEGGKIKCEYSSGKSEEIDLTSDMVKGFDSSKAGPLTLKVEYLGKTAEYSVMVNSRFPDGFENLKLVSKIYDFQERGVYVTGVRPGTKLSDFLKEISFVEYYGDRISVLDSNTKVVGDPVIHTGMTVVLSLPDNNEYQRNIVVIGDTNGDGNASLTDMLQIAAHLEGKTRLKGAYEEAGKITGKGSVSREDLTFMKDLVLGRTKLD